ncbi:MAG TPA: nucleotidyltransferase domain-containing protein [Prevotella sp.]
MRYGLSDETLQLLAETIASAEHVERAELYGSRARGDYKPASDIDIALFGEGITQSEVALLEDKLDGLYLPYFIDIVVFHRLTNPALAENIRRDGKVLYQRA